MNVVTIPLANNSYGGGRVVPNTSIATLSTKHLCAKTFAKLQLGDHPWSSSRFSTVTTTESYPIKTISCLPTAPATTKTPTALIATPILPVLRRVISEEDEHHKGGTRLDQQRLSSAIAARSSSQDSKKRKKTVRFSSTEVTMESSNKVEEADACRKKRRRNQLDTETSAAVSSPSSSASAAPTTASASTTPPPPPLLWYTPTELRSIQRSLIRAVRSYDRHSNTSIVTHTDQDADNEEDAHVLEYYSTRKRYERRNKRHRMLKTCRAVQEFAATIHTPVPLTELLSQLLHRYSSSSS